MFRNTKKGYILLTYAQILIVLCLMMCSGGAVVRTFKKTSKKTDAFPCAGHHCGCKSESDCRTHCCCAPYENYDTYHNNSERQRNGLRVFISSINCKNSDPTSITFAAKYIVKNQVQPIEEAFHCFLFRGTSIYLPEVFVSPPEKPPRPLS